MKKPLMCRLGFHEYSGEVEYSEGDEYIDDLVFVPDPQCWYCGHLPWRYGSLFLIIAITVVAVGISAGLAMWYALT